MCQLAVDFGKRGKCVRKADFEDLNNIIKQIENTQMDQKQQLQRHKNSEEEKQEVEDTLDRKKVLKRLKREINLRKEYDDYIQNDWRSSVALKYKMDQNILSLAFSDHI